jgi:DNA primase
LSEAPKTPQSRARISPELLKKLKESVNLIQVIGEHVVLRKSGANYSGLCPFHSERSPSFSVSEQKQLYHCYGCKASGDIITFMQEQGGMSFNEALEELAERGGIKLPELGEKRSDPTTPIAYRLNLFAATYYRKQLTPEITEYIRKRGVGPETEKAFYVGFAPDGWEGLAKHLVQAKAPLDVGERLGLIRRSQKGGGSVPYFDSFRNRVMFPILDLRGKVAGFGGRTIGDTKDKETPKFLNSPESFLYQKSRLVYGLFQARKHIRELDEVVVTEGYFDVLALHEAGFCQAVAMCGTAMTADHLGLLTRLASKITLLYDGDRAGRDALDRSMEIGLDQGVILRAAFLPEGMDPDELVLQGPEGKARLQQILSDARPLLDLRIEEAVLEAQKGAEERVAAIKRVMAWLVRLQDPVGREVRVQAFREKLKLDADFVKKLMGPQITPKPSITPISTPPSPPSPTALDRAPARMNKSDQLMLQGVLRYRKYPTLWEWLDRNLPGTMARPEIFEHPLVKRFATEVVLEPWLKGGDPAWTLETLPPETPEPLRLAFIAALMDPDSGPEERLLQRSIFKSLSRLWAQFSQQIKAAMNDAESRNDSENLHRLLQEFLDVQRKMKEFGRLYDESQGFSSTGSPRD